MMKNTLFTDIKCMQIYLHYHYAQPQYQRTGPGGTRECQLSHMNPGLHQPQYQVIVSDSMIHTGSIVTCKYVSGVFIFIGASIKRVTRNIPPSMKRGNNKWVLLIQPQCIICNIKQFFILYLNHQLCILCLTICIGTSIVTKSTKRTIPPSMQITSIHHLGL